ncbi:DUF881 domain-containing protein [Proteiniborus sp. MB09-C3]|uniref:DUF881 domain-containing protein n=1 Tax=Proteiniborus sp. MB09-C3 TaxID=3050072 RepID=UPI0025526B1E|nr:DUF881 domain-containing protein [Proteiniborus sp. MB09-C3]WIV13029.1 DUF881 domain-containing protein [Proteiniborus sp. MB09-C3]
MKNIKGMLSVFLVCVLLGVILSIQFKTTQNVTDGANPIAKSKALLAELNNLESQKAQAKKDLAEIEGKIKQLEEEEADKDYHLRTLYNELEKYNMFLGYKEMEGSGVQIEIDEPEAEAIFDDGTSIVAYNYDYLLQIISSLNAANAEAISVNDIRYTSYSTLIAENNTLIFDDHVISTPIIVRAIGDPKELESNMTFRGGILDSMKRQLRLKVNITKKDNIVIPSLNKKTELKYVRPIDNLSD